MKRRYTSRLRKRTPSLSEQMFRGGGYNGFMRSGVPRGGNGFRNEEGYADPTVYAAMKNMEKKRKERARDG